MSYEFHGESTRIFQLNLHVVVSCEEKSLFNLCNMYIQHMYIVNGNITVNKCIALQALAYTFKRDLRYYFENKSILEWYDNLHIMSCLYIKQTEVKMLNLKIITKDASKKFSKRLCMCFYFFYLTLQQVTRLIKNFSKQQTF